MLKPTGQLVKVQGRNMHIRQMGTGDKTIVLMPGLNLGLPSVHFAPLMRDLSQKYTVCVIEHFGYGHSDPTDTPRSNENYVQEIREGLLAAGLEPPYVLMPYSISGIYGEYYAAKYPEEVEKLILLDCTTTVEAAAKEWDYTIDEIKELLEEVEAYAPRTEERIQELIKNESEELTQQGYTEEEINELCTIENDIRTIRAQDMYAFKCMREVMALEIPKEIPILAFSSSMEQFDDDEEREEYEKHFAEYIAKFGERIKLVFVADSDHMEIACEPKYRKIICDEVDAFLGCGK